MVLHLLLSLDFGTESPGAKIFYEFERNGAY